VTAAGITAASFNDPGPSGSPFAADVISSNGRTGLIDASRSGSSQTVVPEPASLLLLGSGLTVLASRVKKGRNRA